MSGTTEAFARISIDVLLKDVGWNLTDGTQADYVLCDRLRCWRQNG